MLIVRTVLVLVMLCSVLLMGGSPKSVEQPKAVIATSTATSTVTPQETQIATATETVVLKETSTPPATTTGTTTPTIVVPKAPTVTATSTSIPQVAKVLPKVWSVPFPEPVRAGCTYVGKATYFHPSAVHTTWDQVIAINIRYGNLPVGYKGYGYYAAIPADQHPYGKWARVTFQGHSIDVQIIDVVAYKDTQGFRSQGKVIDLGQEVFAELFAETYPNNPDYRAQNEGVLRNVCVKVYN